MSRSFKKNLITKVKYDDDGKKFAAKKVRRFYKDKDFVDDRAYDKKIYPQWSVVEYSFRAPTFEDFCKDQLHRHPGLNLKQLQRMYHKWYIAK